MKLSRMFIYDQYKGMRDYLKTQKNYEIARTILYFAISLTLFVAGWIATGKRENLLTIVAVLGCLPACKSMVDMIMFLKHKGCSPENADRIESHLDGLQGCFDRIFTSYDKNFSVAHIVVKGNTICGFTHDASLDEQAFYKHIDAILKKDGFKNTSIKIYKDIDKYTERLEQIRVLDTEEKTTDAIINTLKSVSL